MPTVADPDDAAPARSNVLAIADADRHGSRSSLYREWQALADARAEPARFVSLSFEHCHGMVFSIANRITGSRWEAEDVTQAVFEQLVRRLAKLRDPDRVPGFVRTCAVRISLRQVRRGRFRRSRLQAELPVRDEVAPDDPVDAAALVRQLLSRLPADERAAVVLKYVELCTHDEVAEAMGVSVATARRRIDAGRARLAAMIGEDRTAQILEGRGDDGGGR